MPKEKKNDAEKYLAQKRFTAIDVIACIMIAAGALIFLWGWGIGYLGLPIMIVGIVGIIFSRSARVKDDEYEQIISNIATKNSIELSGKDMISVYDLNEAPATVGKDGKARSRVFAVSQFIFDDDACKINVRRIDACYSIVTEENYSAPLGCECETTEEYISTPFGQKKMAYLILNGDSSVKIPVDATSVDVDNIIKKIERNKK